MGFDGNEIEGDAWKEELKIKSYEVDLRGRVFAPVLLNFMQEAASNHADALHVGSAHLQELGRFWVLSRIGIRINTLPRWGDTLTLYTWPAGTDKLFALREFRIIDEHGDVIVSASSAWLVLDEQKRRPVRIDRLFTERGIPLERDPRGERLQKLPPLGRVDRESGITVQLSDLDVNDHANNAKYVEWVLNSYSKQFVYDNEVYGCSINFLSECGYGDELLIRTVKENDHSFLHSVVRSEHQTESCRIRMRWGIHR